MRLQGLYHVQTSLSEIHDVLVLLQEAVVKLSVLVPELFPSELLIGLARRLLLVLRVPLIIEVFVTRLVLLLRLKKQT